MKTGKPYVPSQDTYMDYGNFADDARHPILSALQVFDEIMTVRTLDCHVVGGETEETTRLTLGGEEYYTYD